jgi:hypothetical protein
LEEVNENKEDSFYATSYEERKSEDDVLFATEVKRWREFNHSEKQVQQLAGAGLKQEVRGRKAGFLLLALKAISPGPKETEGG